MLNLTAKGSFRATRKQLRYAPGQPRGDIYYTLIHNNVLLEYLPAQKNTVGWVLIASIYQMRITIFAINRFANINIRVYRNMVQGRHSQMLDVAIFKTVIIKLRN